MDFRWSRSMPMLVSPLYISPVTYRAISPRRPEQRRRSRRDFYVAGVKTHLIGWDSYPNSNHSPKRLILCGATGTYQKMTRSSSTAELSRAGVYCSTEDLRDKNKTARRATSCEDVYRATATSTTWDSRLSESGVSLNDSHTDLGSYVGLEDVDGVSQYSFGSSSAFHEITIDSELDRPDSDCLSVPGSGYGHDRSRENIIYDRHRDRVGGGGHKKSRHDSGSREKFLSELAASSGRSSPTEDKKEFYHSTPTKRGSPVLTIFPGDEDDMHFPSNLPKDSLPQSLNHSSTDSLLYSPKQASSDSPLFSPIPTRDPTNQMPTDFLSSSPRSGDSKTKTEDSSGESIVSSTEALKEALRKKRNKFFASFHDYSSLEEQSAGESVQSWLTTGHTQRHHAILTDSPAVISDEDSPYQHHQVQPPHQGQQQSPPSSEAGSIRLSVRDMVRTIEQGPSPLMGETGSGSDGSKEAEQTASHLQTGGGNGGGGKGGGGETGRYGAPSASWQAVGEGGGVDGVLAQHLYPSAGNETASLLTTVTGRADPISLGHFLSSVAGEGKKQSTVTGGDVQPSPFSDGYIELSSADGKTPSAFTDLRDREQQTANKAGRTSGTVTGRNEEDGPYLRNINYGSVSSSADQLSDAHYRAVSDHDKLANAGANTTSTTTATTQSLHSAHTWLPGQSGASDVCRSSGGKEDGENAAGERDQSKRNNSASLTSRLSADDQLLSLLSSDWNQDEEDATDMDQYSTDLLDQSTDSFSPHGQTIREVSKHQTRHVHRTRTTVHETVTTRHTEVRHSAGSPTSALGGSDGTQKDDATATRRQGFADDRDYDLTDRTVSRTTVKEEDSEKEETTTRNITRQPLSQCPPGSARETSEFQYTSQSKHSPAKNSTTKDGSILQTGAAYSGDSKYTSKSSYLTSSPRQKKNAPTTADTQNNSNILSSLEEQLSLLSSSLDDNTQYAPQDSGQLFEYTDYAEASLPGTQQTPYSSNLVRGTGSVFITLDKNGSQEASDWKTDGLSGYGPLTSETQQDASRHHARTVQGKVLSHYGEGREDDSSTQRINNSLWRHPASSSEAEDSDGHYTSISTTTSSHRQPHSDSDTASGEGQGHAERDSTVHTFRDFISGLGAHSTFDQPSLHRSVNMIVEDFPSCLFHSCVQETILEADDESETADEDNAYSPTIHSYKTSLHFSVPHSTPKQVFSVSPVPQIRVQDVDQRGLNASEDKTRATHPLQDLSDKLSDISDVSYELHVVNASRSPELSATRKSAGGGPTSSDAGDGSVYSTSASAEVQNMTGLGTPCRLAGSTSVNKQSSRNVSSVFKKPQKSQWVQEKLVLFQKLLNEFDSQRKSPEQALVDEMMVVETGRDREDGGDGGVAGTRSEVCDDLYRCFTREFLEQRQNHTCPVIEDHMPAIRFKRFLKKKHNSKLKGQKTFRIRHQLDKLMETSQTQDSDVKSVSDVRPANDVSPTPTRLSPYHLQPTLRSLSPHKLRGRLVSDVFTDDADVKKSFSSDSAYSSLSSSRHVSDLDSTFRSVTSSRGDVSSIGVDVSMGEEDKLRSLSEVFDHLDVCEERDIDQARLDRLRVGHYKAETL